MPRDQKLTFYQQRRVKLLSEKYWVFKYPFDWKRVYCRQQTFQQEIEVLERLILAREKYLEKYH